MWKNENIDKYFNLQMYNRINGIVMLYCLYQEMPGFENQKYGSFKIMAIIELMAKTYKHSFEGWCSDGKYTRNEETTYTFRGDDSGVRIEEHYQYQDDDGQSDNSDTVHSTGREILNVIEKVFRK